MPQSKPLFPFTSPSNEVNLFLDQCYAANDIKNKKCPNKDCEHRRCRGCCDLDPGSVIEETLEYSYVVD
jgi:hypothetical protein